MTSKKKIVRFAFILSIYMMIGVLLGCNNFFNVDQAITPNSASMEGSLWPQSLNETKNTPIHPEYFWATNDGSTTQFTDHISINWTKQAGVYFCRIFWYATEQEALLAHTALKTTLFQIETLSLSNSSPKITYSASEFDHSALQSGQTYYYILKNYDITSKLIGYSTPFLGTTSKLPYNCNASQDKKEALISITWEWGETWTCEGFKLYRSIYRDKEYTQLGEELIGCSQRSFEDRSISEAQIGDTFYYRLSAVIAGKESPLSPVFFGRTVSENAPNPPQTVIASSGVYTDKIEITWTKPEGGETAGITEYKIYAKIGQTWENPISFSADGDPELKYQYVLAQPKAYTPIRFQITAVNESGEGAPSFPLATGQIIPKVTELQVSYLTNESAIVLNWNDAIATLIQSNPNLVYEVYRDDALLETISTGTSFADATASEGVVYRYKLCVKNTVSTQQSDFSTEENGVKGLVEVPEFTISQGTSTSIIITINNYKSYLNYEVQNSYPFYMPTFTLKDKSNDGSKSLTKPNGYEDSLNYRVNPNYQHSSFSTILSSVSGSTITFAQGSVKPGNNRYRLRASYPVSGTPEFTTIWSQEKIGYRQITDREFLLEALHGVAKSQDKMYYIHQPGTAAANAEWIEDDSKQGNVSQSVGWAHYSPSISGLTVNVPIHYYEYRDYYLTMNCGNHSANLCQKTQVNFSANGTLTGALKYSGIYNGLVTFDLVISSGNKSGGQYRVKQDGKTEVTFAWDFDRAEVVARIGEL